MDFEQVCAAARSARGVRPAVTSDRPAFPFEKRTALRNYGRIDPTDINDYIVRGGGYAALARCLKMAGAEVIARMHPAEAWRTFAQDAADEKHIVCSAVDPDPLARTARLLLESDPHTVLEGMLIAAWAMGAARCVIAVADEYRAAIERLNGALAQMRPYTLLGNAILDSGFSAEIDVKPVSRALVLDDETALLAVLEGKPAMPQLRTGGIRLFGKPALVESAETFARLSDGESAETTVITIAGEAAHQFTVEVPFGTSLRTLVTEAAGGVAGGKPLKAVQLGGPAGAFFDAESLDTRVNSDNAGSGTLKLFSAGSCGVEMARDAISFLQVQSCGKCVFCREGTYQMSVILKDIVEGRGKPADIGLLVELGEAMKTGAICDLGTRAADPVLSAVRLFGDEFDAHINAKGCPARAG